MHKQQEGRRMTLISFSGIDGSGKSTQIERLCAYLGNRGTSFRLVSFWDQVARFTWLRESAGYTVFGGDRGVGTPSAPINRKDKNVRSWFMTCARLGFYLADAFALRKLIQETEAAGLDVLIFDRFIDDELANLPLRNTIVRGYIRTVARFVPRPQLRILVDADPVLARGRKPEYPVEFLELNRRSYFTLSKLIGGFAVVGPGSIQQVQEEVLNFVNLCLSRVLLEGGETTSISMSRVVS